MMASLIGERGRCTMLFKVTDLMQTSHQLYLLKSYQVQLTTNENQHHGCSGDIL